MVIVMLAMGYEGVAFAMGAKPTLISPVCFGIFSIGYILLLIVENFEENPVVRDFADLLSHFFGLLTLFFLVGIVSVEFAIGLCASISIVACCYGTKHFTNNNPNPNTLAVAADSKSEKIHLLVLTVVGGAMFFIQIGLAIGMEKTSLSHVYFGIAAVIYMTCRFFQVLEEEYIVVKSTAGHISSFAGLMALVLLVGLISTEFALAIFFCSILILSRYLCIWWWEELPEDAAEERLIPSGGDNRV